jgi:glucose-6-phosphate 1-dehydrogenase
MNAERPESTSSDAPDAMNAGAPGAMNSDEARAPEAVNPLRAGMEAVREPVPATIVIFGASGDLTRRKLLPALYNLSSEGSLHPQTSIVGLARRDWGDAGFRDRMRRGVDEYSRRTPVDEEVWGQLCGDMRYVRGEFQNANAYRALGRTLDVIDGERGRPGCRLFYLATPPRAYETIARELGRARLTEGPSETASSRLIVEKPFGRDGETASALNRVLHRVFHEDQIYRIDHYLGKETVQNILVFRLDNGIFEPLWNNHHIDHVQITVAETVGVGSRAGFYEEAGVIRDMLQNHLMQLLTLVCMEPPVRFDAKSVRDEKVKILRALRPLSPDDVRRWVVRGQHTAGVVEGVEVAGYREEEGVDENSRTETYLAARLRIENWRWAGTPFYLRSGKRLPKRVTEIAIVFKAPPYDLFPGTGPSRRPNVLRLRIQPEEGISLSFESKAPGQELHIDEVRMDFSYTASFGRQSPEAYERLLLDAVQGDSTLFAREDEVELSWRLVDQIAAAWAMDPRERPYAYEAGTWGPEAADRMIKADGRRWLRP